MNDQTNAPAMMPVTSILEKMNVRFKTPKLSDADKAAGKEPEKAREAFEVAVPVPDKDGTLAIINNGGKAWELLHQAMYDLIYTQLRGQITGLIEANASIVLSPEVIDLSKLTWDAIANMPAKERAGSAIPKEIWDRFQADYIAIMPALTGKPKEAAENAAAVFVKKMVPAKTRKDLLPTFSNRLDLWLANTELVAEDAEDAEAFAGLYTYLKGRIEDYLNAEIVLSEEAI